MRMQRNFYSVLLIALFSACSHAAVIRPDYSPLDSYASIKEGQIAVVGHVVLVENITIVNKYGVPNIYPEILISVERTLFGPDLREVKVVGFNTFFLREGMWCTRVVSGAPWLVPGDRVVVIGKERKEDVIGKGKVPVYRLRDTGFILDDSPVNNNQIYDYRVMKMGGVQVEYGKEEKLDTILSSLVREAVPQNYSMSDIVAAIERRGKK